MQPRKRAKFAYLLAGLLVVLVAGPLVYEFTQQSASVVWQIAFSLTLVIGIWSLVDNRRWFIVGIVLVVADVALTIVVLLNDSALAKILVTALEVMFLSISLVIALNHVLFGRGMDVNRIIGAICVYLLLGILLGIINANLFLFVPDSFNGIDSTEADIQGFTLIYYSFVTMTTLGYGDITPAGPVARVVAYLAATAGQFYIAILVAMVVGQYLSQANARDDDG
ncbi:MAG: potassium channel family protein [Gammaproteobacteria bacterium]